VWQPLRARATAPEWMDILPVEEADFARCLADLEMVNRLTRATAPTLRFIDRLTAGWPPGAELRILDAGSGAGGMLRAIHVHAAARGLVPRLVGVDLNPQAAAIARSLTPAGMGIRFETADIFAFRPEAPPHAITSALFAHHLDDAGVTRFLGWMEGLATRGWFVNDLHRHWFAAHGFRLLANVARWHRFVRHDGPLSVARAFVADDWQGLLAAAGIGGATLSWHMPFRLCVTRLKPA
jgi:SAM-dependent methyltransferase